MIYIIQAEDRSDDTLDFLMASVKRESKEHGKYILCNNPRDLGEQIAPKSVKYPQTYAKLILLQDFVKRVKDGDTVVYIDSDMYVKTFDGYFEYLQNSHKYMFFTSYLTGLVNSGLIAIKVNDDTRKIMAELPTKIEKHTRDNYLGETQPTTDEEIWNYSFENNINGINRYIDFVPTTRFSSIPQKELFGNPIDYLQINKDTEIFHFMRESKSYYDKILGKWL